MPHDPVHADEVQGWLKLAERDLAAGEHALDAEPPFTGDSVFHAQQSAEKSFKALLTWHDRPFRKTHSLEELGEQCLEMEAGLKALVDSVVPLTEYAWRFRYPGEVSFPSESEARDALSVSRKLFEAILSRLPPETHP